jgi:hypothetical protein
MDRRSLLMRAALGFTALPSGMLAACGGGGGGGEVDDTGAEQTGGGSTSSAASVMPPPLSPAPAQSAAGGDLYESGAGYQIRRRSINVVSMLIIDGYFEGGRYERYQRVTVLSGATARVRFFGYNIGGGGASKTLNLGSYKLLVDGVERARVDVAAGAREATFQLNLAPLTEGWHTLDVVGTIGFSGEWCPTWPVWVSKGGRPAQPLMPVTTGTYGLLHGPDPSTYVHITATVPAVFKPTVLRLAARETPAFNTALPRAELVQAQWAPARRDDVHRTNVTADGVWTTHNRQPYFWSDFTAKLPPLPLLDGPRGQATIVMPTHLQVGRRGSAYFVDPWRVGKIEPDGTVTTLAGWRHKAPPSFWGSPQQLELVGDWSSMPAERRGFHEAWGLAWDPASLVTDPSAGLIDGELPHLTGPRAFISDSQNNRVCVIEFSRDSHTAVPVVKEFITGLGDPWDVVCDGHLLYVSERSRHRIAAYNTRTGVLDHVLVFGAGLATVSSVNRFVTRRGTLAQLRTQPCVAPEGLFLQDDWLYFGSYAMAQVKRVHLRTGQVEVVAEPTLDGNSTFMKIALSDGSFGPRGTVFVAHWSNNYFGYPVAHLPGGKRWDYLSGTNRGIPWAGAGYPTAVAVGQGKMLCGSSAEGLLVHSKALASDKAIPSAYGRGEKEWLRRGFHLTHGPAGFGYYGLPLPWGASADIDVYLTTQGHVKP